MKTNTLKTKATPFYPDLSAGPGVTVFSVNSGYPAGHALDLADTFLDAAIQTVIDAAGNLPPSSEASAIYCAIYTLEQAHALIGAVIGGGDGQGENAAGNGGAA